MTFVNPFPGPPIHPIDRSRSTATRDRSAAAAVRLLGLEPLVLDAHHGLAVGEVRRVDEADDPLVAL